MATAKIPSKKEDSQTRVLNAFESFFSAKKNAEEEAKAHPEKAKSPAKKELRDKNITKVCASCGKEYHPTKNGYSQVSKYCSITCTKAGTSKKFY